MPKNFWFGKKVFITGHTGFKGSWLSIWLISKGASIYGYSLAPPKDISLFNSLNLNNYAKEKNCEYNNFKGDIRDKDLLEKQLESIKPDLVFHLAAQPIVRDSYIDPLYTWETNVMGTINLLESLKTINKKCGVLIISTDKVYENNEWLYGYREIDKLGGHDPYSSSKAAMELAVQSWRRSFCGEKSYQNRFLNIATARAGNVIGGGDWAKDRIIPDIIRGYKNNIEINIRNPNSTRPWQHVLDPINGYLVLAENLYRSTEFNQNNFSSAFNFGPSINSNLKVKSLIDNIKIYMPLEVNFLKETEVKHESKLLYLNSEKAKRILNWEPKLDFKKSLEMTINWYKSFLKEGNALESCIKDINYFENISDEK